ncbi:MAG: M24 family metallopeptidase [Bacilli bacterium]
MKHRIQKLQNYMKTQQLDAFLITSTTNRRYMTGFTGTSGYALVTKESAYFITDFRYIDQATTQTDGYEIVQHVGPIVQEVAELLKKLSVEKLGFEKDFVSYGTYELYAALWTNTQLLGTSGVVENFRHVKDEEELIIMREAADIADKAFAHICTYIKPGQKETDVRDELEMSMRKLGADCSSFEIIVASGVRSSLPHGVASEKIIEAGDVITLDFGAYYKGYCSDITRTIAVGHISDEMKHIYDTVLQAQEHAVANIKAGLTGKEADALARDIIAAAGYGPNFGHSTGHGLGMDVHEQPGVNSKNEEPLQIGMVVTVEPGIYVSNLGGVRIEDDVVLTENGCEVLTHSPKHLIILPIE